MSWQAYVDDHLVASGFVTKAAIHGHAGGVWATSAGFNVTQAEAAALANAFVSPDALYSGGIRAGGVKYMFVSIDPDTGTLIGRKGGDSGIIVCKTNQAIVIGVYEGGIQPGSCNTTVSKMADHLKASNY